MTDPRKQGIIVNVDYETDGPNIFKNSLRSIGATVTLPNGEVSDFYMNVSPQLGHEPNPLTMKNFWDKEPEAWAALQKPAPVPLDKAWDKFDAWLRNIHPGGKIIMAAYPLGFEKTITDIIYMQRGMDNPFGINGIDIRSYAAGALGVSYENAGKENWPKEWTDGAPAFTHQALDDAKNQAYILDRMIKWNARKSKISYTDIIKQVFDQMEEKRLYVSPENKEELTPALHGLITAHLLSRFAKDIPPQLSTRESEVEVRRKIATLGISDPIAAKILTERIGDLFRDEIRVAFGSERGIS